MSGPSTLKPLIALDCIETTANAVQRVLDDLPPHSVKHAQWQKILSDLRDLRHAMQEAS